MNNLFFSINEVPATDAIPVLPSVEFTRCAMECLKNGDRLLALFGIPDGSGKANLYAVFARQDGLCAMRSEALSEYDSMAGECPQTQLFEREIYESLGIMPNHHPWLKAVRISPDATGKSRNAEYGFFRIQGGQTHEVAVGPIHAGIIEPGHFRFQCYGENVLNLEIALGYQHRGVEAMLLRLPPASTTNHLRLRLVECVAGDASIAHATAHCSMWEKMLGLSEISEYSQRMRRVGLELERLACHCGDLGAIAGDTGYLPTSSWNGRIRGDFLNMTATICGNRFGREYISLGGVDVVIRPEECEALISKLKTIGVDAVGSCKVMFASGSVHERMAGTGALTMQQARELGLVGVPARACGLDYDSRFQFPLSDLPLYDTRPRIEKSGDVLARAKVRFMEMKDSIELVSSDLKWLSTGMPDKPKQHNSRLPAGKLAVGLVESWRGEVCHVGVTGPGGELLACKIIDPSFHNWIGLSMAMRDGQISDFPLCNKSFNLSYCGHDL